MSRLRPLHIPFAQGFSEEVDAKVLPDGVFRTLRNGRIDRVGSLRMRRGWRPVDMDVVSDDGIAIGGDYEALDLYSAGDSLVALVAVDDARLAVQTLVEHAASRPWVRRRQTHVPPVTDVRAVGQVPDLSTSVVAASAAVTSDGVWGATLVQSTTKTVLRVYRLANDETLFYDDFASSTDSAVRKVVSLGSTFGIVRNDTTSLDLQIFNPAAASSGLGALVTLVTAVVTHFDVAVAPETTPGFLHLVYVVAGEVSYARFSTAGVQSGSTKQVVASGAQAAYLATDDVTAHCVYQDLADDALHLLSFQATGSYTTLDGPTALNGTTGYGIARFAVGYTPTSAAVWVAAEGPTGFTVDMIEVVESSHAITAIIEHGSTSLVGGWVTRGAYAGFGFLRGATAGQFDLGYTDSAGPWFAASFNLGRVQSAGGPWAPGQAPTGDVVSLLPRASDVTAATSRAAGQIATTQALVRTWRVFDQTRRRPGVEFAGALYLTGGVLTQVLSGGLAENGMLKPVISAVVDSNGSGTIANGVYQYRAVVVWTDRGGRLHRSQVSDSVSNTTAGADDTVTVSVDIPKTLRRDPDLDIDPVVELYRTEAGPGELFYHVASAVAAAAADDTIAVVDTSPDATIVDNKRLYTEGEFGSVSGALDVTLPNPSSFAAVLRDRLVLASSNAAEYQFSQIALPEEPVAFTQPGVSGPTAFAYQDAVEGGITALATLDQTVVLGTATRLFITEGGEGPNLAGVGEFPSPARLPSDVGVYDARSLVEDANGLWFLGTVDRLYVLPRGQSSPTAVDTATDQFAAGTLVGAGVDSDQDATCWAVADGTDSVLVARHAVTPNPWSIDDLPFTPRALVAHGGGLYAIDDVGAVWTNVADVYGDGSAGATAVVLQVETGDVQVFGQGGHGRLAVVETLGEYQSDATVLLEVSYDMGLTWDAISTAFTVSGLAAGTAFQRRWTPARQRGGKFRLRITMTPSSTTAEGCRLTGLSLYYVPSGGPTRLVGAKRR
jgi:hypothetical protein